MESYIFTSSLKEFTRARRLWPWLALCVLAALLAFVWQKLSPDASPADRYASVSSMIVFRMIALVSAIFATAIVSQEVEQKTIVYLLTRPVPRWKLVVFRFLAGALVVSVIGAIGALCVSLGAFNTGFLSNSLLVKDILAMVFAAFAYGALFLFVSLLFNRAMIICLIYAFGIETALPNLPGDISRLSIYSYLQAIAEHPSTSSPSQGLNLAAGDLGLNTLTASVAIPSLVILTAVCLGLSAYWFTKFEYVPREDAE